MRLHSGAEDPAHSPPAMLSPTQQVSPAQPLMATRRVRYTTGVPEALSRSRLRRSAAFDAGATRVAKAPREAVVTIGGRRLGPYERTGVIMSRLGPRARAVVTIVVGTLFVGGGLAPKVLAQTAPDRSEVVLVLDFSASILEDATNRNRFGAALERIADRVSETSSDLVAGDATVTIVQFATRAADYQGCADLKLLDSAQTV